MFCKYMMSVQFRPAPVNVLCVWKSMSLSKFLGITSLLILGFAVWVLGGRDGEVPEDPEE